MNPYIVGITGGSASGKTLFLRSMVQAFEPSQICVITQDDYYKTKEEQPLDLNGIENYDTPHSIDVDLFIKNLLDLKSGKEVQKQEYTFNNPALQPKMLLYRPAPIILVEGIFIFYYPEIMNLLDLKIFIEAKEHIKVKRRLSRDLTERGYNADDVLYRYEYHVSPTYERYIKPFMERADIIIPNNESFQNALQVIVGFLKCRLERK